MTSKTISVLTPAAASYLFDKAIETVRRAAKLGLVEVAFTMTMTRKVVRLITLESALRYWKVNLPESQPGFEQTLLTMASNGFPITVAGQLYQVLHPFSIATPGDSSILPDAE